MAERTLDGARVVVTGAAGFLGSHVTDEPELPTQTLTVRSPRPPGDAHVRRPDLARARTLPGRPARTPLELGLARTVAEVHGG